MSLPGRHAAVSAGRGMHEALIALSVIAPTYFWRRIDLREESGKNSREFPVFGFEFPFIAFRIPGYLGRNSQQHVDNVHISGKARRIFPVKSRFHGNLGRHPGSATQSAGYPPFSASTVPAKWREPQIRMQAGVGSAVMRAGQVGDALDGADDQRGETACRTGAQLARQPGGGVAPSCCAPKGKERSGDIRSGAWCPPAFHRASSDAAESGRNVGAPGEIRTHDLCLRRAALYPAELRVRGARAVDCPRLRLDTTAAMAMQQSSGSRRSFAHPPVAGQPGLPIGLISRIICGHPFAAKALV